VGVETKHTFCRICEAACGLEVDVDGADVIAVRPDRSHVASRGYLCVKGPAYREVHGSPDRVLRPQRRTGETWRDESWDDALAAIGGRLREIRERHGRDAVGIYVGNPSAFSTTHAIFAQAFVTGLGTRHLFTAGSQDCNNKFVVAEAMYGSPALQPVPDLDHAGCVIVLGSNPAISQMSFANVPRPIERLTGIVERGGRVFIVDPRKTESVKSVGEHVPIRPGTDVFMLLSLLHVLGEREAIRSRDGLRGADALAAVAKPWPPERTAGVTGVPAERVREMATAIIDARGASLYCSTGVNQGGQGTLAFWLAQAINAATGNLDRRGGAVVPPGLLDISRVEILVGILCL